MVLLRVRIEISYITSLDNNGRFRRVYLGMSMSRIKSARESKFEAWARLD